MKTVKPKNKIEELLMGFMGEMGLIDDNEDIKDLESKCKWEEFYEWLKGELK